MYFRIYTNILNFHCLKVRLADLVIRFPSLSRSLLVSVIAQMVTSKRLEKRDAGDFYHTVMVAKHAAQLVQVDTFWGYFVEDDYTTISLGWFQSLFSVLFVN